MRIQHEELLVKANSLAAEKRVIRNQAIRLKKRLEKARQKIKSGKITNEEFLANARLKLTEKHDSLISLRHHEKHVVSREARHTHLARMFLKGVPYEVVEQFTWTIPDWRKVEEMVARFSGHGVIVETNPVTKQIVNKVNIAPIHNAFKAWIAGQSERIQASLTPAHSRHTTSRYMARKNHKTNTRDEALAKGVIDEHNRKLMMYLDIETQIRKYGTE